MEHRFSTCGKISGMGYSFGTIVIKKHQQIDADEIITDNLLSTFEIDKNGISHDEYLGEHWSRNQDGLIGYFANPYFILIEDQINLIEDKLLEEWSVTLQTEVLRIDYSSTVDAGGLIIYKKGALIRRVCWGMEGYEDYVDDIPESALEAMKEIGQPTIYEKDTGDPLDIAHNFMDDGTYIHDIKGMIVYSKKAKTNVEKFLNTSIEGLSPRAKNYLNNLKRSKEWVADSTATEMYLQQQNVTANSAIINFQHYFSGLELTIKNKRNQTFYASLFLKDAILNNDPLSVDEIDEKFIYVCGHHATAQFTFYLTDRGEIAVFRDKNKLNIIYSSFPKMLESYALRNEIHNWVEIPYYYEVEDQAQLDQLFSNQFERFESCSDDYANWWKDEYLIIDNSIWLDRAERYLHIYGKNKIACQSFVDELKRRKII